MIALMKIEIEKVPILGPFISWMDGFGFDYAPYFFILALFILYLVFGSSASLAGTSISFFLSLAPIWLPLITFDIFFYKWMDMVGSEFKLQNGRTTFRIKLPQEVRKSPEAMEFILNQIWNPMNPDNFWQTYIDGKQPLVTSLEIVSIGGDVRFYINMPTKRGKETLLPSMYSQYPGIEVIEEPVDYAAEIVTDDDEWESITFHLGKKEKQYAPIKTYIDFGLDNTNTKEEEKVDPLTPMLEVLGNISPNERVYYQILLKSFRKSSFKNGQLQLGEGDDWTKGAQDHVNEILQRDPKTKAATPELEGSPRTSPGERDKVEAIERNMSKYAFKVNMRYVYLARKGHFNANNIGPINRTFSQFDKLGRGSIGIRWRTDFDYKWVSRSIWQKDS